MESNLKLFTYKTLILIALASDQRAQILAKKKKLIINNIRFDEEGTSIVIDVMTKTTSINNPHVYLYLPYFGNRPNYALHRI